MPFEVKVVEDYKFPSATCLYGMTIPKGEWTKIDKDALRPKAERTNFLEVRDSATTVLIDPDPPPPPPPPEPPLTLISEAAARLMKDNGLEVGDINPKVPGTINVMDVRKAIKSKEG